MNMLMRPDSLSPPVNCRRDPNEANLLTRRFVEGFFTTVEQCLTGLEAATALEVGCGEGFSTQRIRHMLPETTLHASDIEWRLVEAARKRNPQIPITQESIYQLGHDDNAYELVVALNVLEHLDDPDRAMAELCRVSSRWILVSVPREPIWRALNMLRFHYLLDLGNTPGHVQHWSARQFSRFVGQYAEVRRCYKPIPWTVILAELRP